MIIGVLQDQASRSIDVLRKFVDSLPTGGDEHQLGLEKVTLMEQQRSKHEKLLDVDKTISALTPDAVMQSLDLRQQVTLSLIHVM